MSRWLTRLVVIAAVVAVIVALRLTVFRPEGVPVTIFRVARGLVEETVTNSKAGTVKSRRRATLAPEVGGRVAELPVGKGDSVVAGQLLLRVADGDYRAQVSLAERVVETARANQRQSCVAADQAQRDLVRSEALAKDELISQTLLEQARS